MPSKILGAMLQSKNNFPSVFSTIMYDLTNKHPIKDIWKDLSINIKQEEKKSDYLFLYHEFKQSDTIESLSETYYGNINLWWLILLTNEVNDPFDYKDTFLELGAVKILKGEHIPKLLNTIQEKNQLFNYLSNHE
jgi:hypothetical protein